MRLALTVPGLTGPEGGETWPNRDLHAQLQRMARAKVSRRGFLQGSTLAATSAFLAACSRTRAVAAAASAAPGGSAAPAGTPVPSFAVPADIEKELFMYNWADYVDTGSMALFQQAFGVEKFAYATFASNEDDARQARRPAASASTTSAPRRPSTRRAWSKKA